MEKKHCHLCEDLVDDMKEHLSSRHKNFMALNGTSQRMQREPKLNINDATIKQECSPISPQSMKLKEKVIGTVAGHKVVVDGLKMYACPLCQHSSWSKRVLLKHLAFDHAELSRYVYPVVQCDKYRDIRHNEQIFTRRTCQLCSRSVTYSGVHRHIIDNHWPKSLYSCNACDVQSKRSQTLQRHIARKHTQLNPFTDYYDHRKDKGYKEKFTKLRLLCFPVFEEQREEMKKKSQRQGNREVTAGVDYVIKKSRRAAAAVDCRLCDRRISPGMKSALWKHLFKHVPDHIKMFSCPLCKVRGKYMGGMREHMRNFHGKDGKELTPVDHRKKHYALLQQLRLNCYGKINC